MVPPVDCANTFAVIYGYAEIVEKLLAAGAPVECPERDWDSYLITAARREHEDVVRVLLAAGADPFVCDKNGMTAVDYLAQNGLHTIAKLVQKHMKSPKHFLSAVARGNLDIVRRLVNAKLV